MFNIKKYAYLGIIGLGLGLGMSIIIFSQPSKLQATPDYQIQQSTDFKKIIFNNYNLNITQAEYLTLLTKLQKSNIVQKNNQLAFKNIKYLDNLSLGDQIKFEGLNNGLYEFNIIEIKYIKTQNYLEILENYKNNFILFSQANLLGSELLVLLIK